jgi:four helix bundle protein
MNLAEKVYHLTYQFPKQETYKLSSQIQRAAVSVPSNIAEGHTRDSTLLGVRSEELLCAELETQLILGERLSYLDIQDLQTVLSKTDEVSRIIRGLQKALKAKL